MSNAEDELESVAEPTGTNPATLRWYFTGHASWYAALGLQMVLFPFLTAFVLDLDARYVGLAQLALMGPGIILLMPGGVIADHVDERNYLVRLHILASLPPLAMATVLFADKLSFGFIIGYALVAGSLSTLAIPARDSLLNHLVPHEQLNRLIALATAMQFGGQLIGMTIAAFAGTSGPAPFFILHSLIMLFGALCLRRIMVPAHAKSHTPLGKDLGLYFRSTREALVALFESKVLAPVMICNSAVGFLFVGSFMVAVPIFVRDVFHGTASSISQLHISFFAGTVISALIIMRIGTIRPRGKFIMIGLTAGAAICFLMSMDIPFWLFAVFMFCWGLGAGFVMTNSRTIIQEAAPERMRARMLAAFQLGIMGFGPLGSFTSGFIIDRVGPQKAMLVPGAGMIAVLIFVAVFTSLWNLTSDDTAKSVTN